jgi:microcystin-dependent protein
MAVEPYIGEISIVVFDYAPPGWMLCDGTVLPVNQHQALFALIGNRYGGDGVQTFALPDLRGRFPLGMGLAAGRTARKLGDYGGVEQTALTLNQLPVHTHVAASHSHPMPHSHALTAHNHPMPHTHPVGSHNHPMPHAHDMASHTHTATHSHGMNAGSGIDGGGEPAGHFLGSTGNTRIYSGSGGKVMNSGVISPDSTPTGGPSVANTGASSAASTADASAGNTGASSSASTGDGSGATGGSSNPNTDIAAVTIGNSGASAKLDIMNPFQCLNFIIAIEGTFPSRS